jgi:leucyl-tRNA synthetase
MVIAPEHPFVERLTSPDRAEEVRAYCDRAAAKSDRERTEVAKAKTGVFTGAQAINPVNGKPLPIWIADYVLISYGTGAIMAVPGQDERDWEFAEVFGLPIIRTVQPPEDFDGKAYVGEGPAINSEFLDGLEIAEAKSTITDWLSERGLGQAKVNYKLRDWLFSRQRFWGEPFPVLHELDAAGNPTGAIRSVDPQELPVDLPHLEDYKPIGKPEPPLAKAGDDWLYVEVDGKRYRRETNTMPQWAGSCWYYLRFIDPKNDKALVDKAKEQAWMPVDLYVGGAEHAVLHLLYARFWHKVLYDRGYVSTQEPFQRLVNQGMILGEMEFTGFQRVDSSWLNTSDLRKVDSGGFVEAATGEVVNSIQVSADEVVKAGDNFVLASQPEIRVDARSNKMSKSRGNVVNPDDIVREFGADALRLYEMFMGPLEATKPWSMAGVGGVRSFLDRAWRMIVDEREEQPVLNAAVQDVDARDDDLRVLHKTIQAVTNDLEEMSFNTAIARLMEFVNHFTKQKVRPIAVMKKFVLLLSPMAPHIGEELWQLLGNKTSLAYEPWPEFDEKLTVDALAEIPVQINGKIKTKLHVQADITRDQLEAAARSDAVIAKLLDGRNVKKLIVVPGRLVNFVV